MGGVTRQGERIEVAQVENREPVLILQEGIHIGGIEQGWRVPAARLEILRHRDQQDLPHCWKPVQQPVRGKFLS